MTLRVNEAEGALLEILFGRRRDESALTDLTLDEWEGLLDLCRMHRVEPLLHWRLRDTDHGDPAPASVRRRLTAAFRTSAVRSLTVRAELVRVGGALDAESIPYLALKGAALAFDTYPHPALRPMRDLDVLVPPDQALGAFRVCLDAGYGRTCARDPAAVLVESHHLPVLLSPGGRVRLELHRTLADPEATGGARRAPLGEDPGFWGRAKARDVASTSISFPSDTDTLLHLLVHAVYVHRFDNGPLSVTDLLFLLRTGEVDWDLFWHLADTGGWRRGCELGLAMAARCDPDLGVRWSGGDPPKVPDGVLRTAFALTLSPPDHRTDRALRAALATATAAERASLLLRKTFPPRDVVARNHGVSSASPTILAHYPRHWARLLAERVPSYLRLLRSERGGEETEGMAALDRWVDR